MLRTVGETVPERAPSLVFYDIANDQLEGFRELVAAQPGFDGVNTTPLVLGRLVAIDGAPLSENDDGERAREANDEQKLTHRTAGIDNITVSRGAWWPDGPTEGPRIAMEDREADQAGVEVGDVLTFSILGEELDATLDAIYAQANFETSFWFEAAFSDGALEPFVTRHVGNAFFAPGTEEAVLSAVGAEYPNVVTISTVSVLAAARSILAAASLGVALVALVSLAASVLVMASVVAVNRQRQVHEASVLHAVGTRMGTVLRAIGLEYALLAALLTAFATLAGGALGWAVMHWWIELPAVGLATTGLAVAALVSGACLAAGAWWTARVLDARPATLLRRAA